MTIRRHQTLLRLKASQWVSSYGTFKKKERKTVKNHNDRQDDLHVRPFELVTLHELGLLCFHMRSLHSPAVCLWSVSTTPWESEEKRTNLNMCKSYLRLSLQPADQVTASNRRMLIKLALQRENGRFAADGGWEGAGGGRRKNTVGWLNWLSFQVRG